MGHSYEDIWGVNKEDIDFKLWCKRKRLEIIKETTRDFEFLTTEQKINKLIDIYASSKADKYDYCYNNFLQDKLNKKH